MLDTLQMFFTQNVITRLDFTKKTKVINESTDLIRQMIVDNQEDQIEERLGIFVSKKEATRKNNHEFIKERSLDREKTIKAEE